jgi:ribosomal-protein-alanine N-acetyltransferase
MIEEIKDISLLKNIFNEYKKDYNPIINDYTKVYAYKLDNKYVSFIVAQILYENAEIIDIFTLEDYRRQGIAKKLLKEVIDNKQVENITLEVNINNKNAIMLYNSLGFKEATIRKGYYNGEDALLMLMVKE